MTPQQPIWISGGSPIRFHSGVVLSKIVWFRPSYSVYVMTPYFNACDVTVSNSNHKIFYNFLTCACAPHFKKGSATHAADTINPCGKIWPAQVFDICNLGIIGVANLSWFVGTFEKNSTGFQLLIRPLA